MTTMDPLSRTLSALADPTRRAILNRLSEGKATVNDFAAPFAISLPAISWHLKVLEHAGLISRGRNAQWRPCRLETRSLEEVATWISEYQQFWENKLDQLEAHLRQLQKEIPLGNDIGSEDNDRFPRETDDHD